MYGVTSQPTLIQPDASVASLLRKDSIYEAYPCDCRINSDVDLSCNLSALAASFRI